MKKLLLMMLMMPGLAGALELKPLIHMDLRGGLSGVQGGPSTSLIQGQLFAVPALQLSERASFTPSLYFVGGGQERSLEETALFVRTASMGVRPQLKLRTEDGNAWSLKADLRHAYNVEGVNESVGTGHYDYEDYGVGASYERAQVGTPWGAGVMLNHRGYPNYHNLAAEQTQGKDYYLKDFNGALGEGHVDLAPFGRLSGSLQWRQYPDAYVVNADTGAVQLDQAQHDLLMDASLRGGLGLDEAGHLALGWELSWQGSGSNQNGFDALHLPDQKLKNSTDYSAYALGLSAQWRPGDTWSLQGGYTANFRNFNRPIQDLAGNYQQGLIAEVEHDLSLGFRVPMAWSTALVGGADARFLLSDQQYAAAGLPSYNYYSGTLGVQWDWKGGGD